MTMEQPAYLHAPFANSGFNRLPAPRGERRAIDGVDDPLREDAYANVLGMAGAATFLAATATAIGAALVAIVIAIV